MQPNYGQYGQPAPQGYGYPPQGGAPVPYPTQPQFQQPVYPQGQTMAQQYDRPQDQQIPPQPGLANLPQGEFEDPRVRGGELAPKVRHLAGDVQAQPPKRGRTVIILPLKIDENAKGLPRPDGTVPINPCAYVDLIVVDGGPIEFGDEWKASRQVRPNTHRTDAPYRITNTMIGNTWIVNAIREAMPPLGKGLLLGVLETGTQGNNPFLITTCETDAVGQERPDGAQRREAARQLWQLVKAGQFTNPPVVPLQPAPGSAYAQPTGYAPQTQPQYAQPQPQYGAQAYGPTHTPQPRPASAGLPPDFDVTQPPPGWDAGAWQPFAANPTQAAAIWAQVFASGQMGQPQQAPAPQGQPQYGGQPVDPNGQPYAAQGNPGW